MSEVGIDRIHILNELNRSAHGNLREYQPIIGEACRVDPEFLAHLIAYDYVHGQIKDSKVALPVLTVAHRDFPDELVENSLAHLVALSPREILRGLRFAVEMATPARRQRLIERAIRLYLTEQENDFGRWSRKVARHRRAIKSLYCLTHKRAPEYASAVLFGFVRENGQKIPKPLPAGSVFVDIANLSKMPPNLAAAAIQKWHLSPLVVSGAMAGSKALEDSAVVHATVEQMSATEVVTQAAAIERKGLKRDQALKETVRKKIAAAATSDKATLKTSVAADEVEDNSLRTMLRELQERQIQNLKDTGKGIDGNWLVIADKSGSMEIGIEVAKHVAAAIAKFVTGKVWLVFCDTTVAAYNVTGMPLEKIRKVTQYIQANGGTSYGVGLEWAKDKELDGIVIVGDGGENNAPIFANAYLAYQKRHGGKDVPVYFFETINSAWAGYDGAFQTYMKTAGLAFTPFDLRHGKVDYYSIPNLVQQMSANRFGLIDRVMAAPLLTLETVLPNAAQKGATC